MPTCNMVQVIASEICTDKNGREYNRATLRTMPTANEWTDPNTGVVYQMLEPGVTTRAIGYQVPYLFEADDTAAVPDYLWDARPNMVIKGTIITRQVMPYEIDGNTRNTATVFVQGDFTSDAAFESAVKMAFERSGRTLVEHAVSVPTEPTEANTLGALLDSHSGI